MKKHRGLVVAAACLLLGGSLWGTVIKIGSIAPTRSPWARRTPPRLFWVVAQFRGW